MDPHLEQLLRAMLSLRTVPEAGRFFRDLMTDDELDMIARRWWVVSMLNEGRSYRHIEEATGMSSRTVARIARWFKEGPGGYKLALERNQPMDQPSLAATRVPRRSAAETGRGARTG